jgi:hypothetical protein
MYTTVRHELCHARRAWPGTLLLTHAFSGNHSPATPAAQSSKAADTVH